MSKIQELYDACDRNFSSRKEGLPTLKQIRWLQRLLDAMEPADVGIDTTITDERSMEDDSIPKSQHGLFLAQSVTQVTYIHIHECDDFSIGVFCFPAGATFPLHDHPNMVVLSKVLYGSVLLKSYDWVTTPNSRLRKSGLARIVADGRVVEAPCNALVLFPRSGGNLHSFTAITPCAVLDVLAPPYSDEQERPSTYFNEIPIPSLPVRQMRRSMGVFWNYSFVREFPSPTSCCSAVCKRIFAQQPADLARKACAILEETDLPEDFTVVGAPYVGPELTVEMEDYY